MVKIVGVILWIVVAWLVVSFAWGVRKNTWSGFGVTMQTVNQATLFAVQAAVVAILGLNPLHFLWMIPPAFILGAMSLVFPFSLLSILGRVYAGLCCTGLDRDVVERNKERPRYVHQLLAAGHTLDEATLMALKNYPGNR
jgi:hypothetical protein